MIGTIFVWLGALGVGLLVWLFAMVCLPYYIPDITEKAFWRVGTIAGILVWVLLAKIHTTLDEPDWPWVILYVICWVLSIVAGSMIYVATNEPD